MSAFSTLEPQSGNVILANERLRLTFIKGERGYGKYLIETIDGHGQAYLVGQGAPFCKVIYRSRRNFGHNAYISPDLCGLEEIENGSATRAQFKAIFQDADKVLWHFDFSFTIRPNQGYVEANYHLETEEAVQLVLFHGPNLQAGEGSFAAKKDIALLPGVEYLEGDEVSGSARDVGQAFAWGRAIPHPNRITIPLMAVLYQGQLLGMSWDPLFRWDGGEDRMSVRFASPDWLEHDFRKEYQQAHHLMGIFVPSAHRWLNGTPDELDQRSIGQTASTPYPLIPWKPLTIRCRILAGADMSVPKLFQQYIADNGLPQLPPLPRSYEDGIDLSHQAYVDTWWVEQASGWLGFHGRPFKELATKRAQPAIVGAEHLLRAAWRAPERRTANMLRERAARVVEAVLQNAQDAEVGALRSEYRHFPLNYALRLGHVEDFLGFARSSVDYWISKHKSDGSYRYGDELHFDSDHLPLGPADGTTVGTCAPYVHYLLKYARITGDSHSLAAGMKGLAYMQRFQVPRGANTWEVPLYAPDQLGSYWAMECYLEAFYLTEDRKYIEQAACWAATGLPFTYFWSAPERPIMRYGTIPVIGCTWYRELWIGQLVQWIGLEYARALFHLAKFDDSLPWAKIAEGITIAGMQQQEEFGDYKGGMTDAVNMVSGYVSAYWMAPDLVLRNLYLMQGEDAEVSTIILRQADKKQHVSSGARLLKAFSDQDEVLTIDLAYRPGETSHTLVQTEDSPVYVEVNSRRLNAAENLDAVEEGWKYLPAFHLLLVKTRHSEATRLVIQQ
ncbi:MAG: hypothetical protein ACYC6L_13895 [Anaerolineae bacterium]